MDELSAKMVIYKVIASSEQNRRGVTRMCARCGKEYTDNIASDASYVTCCTCSMGLADGVFTPEVKKQRKFRFGKIDVEGRLRNGKDSNGS